MINQTDATDKIIAITCEKMSDNKELNDEKESEMKSIQSKERNGIDMDNRTRDNAFPIDIISANNENYNNNNSNPDDLITSDKINSSGNTYEVDDNVVYADERRSPNVQNNIVKEIDDQLCQGDIPHLNSRVEPKQENDLQNIPNQETSTIAKGIKSKTKLLFNFYVP